MKIFTAEQMRAFDRAATQEYGIPSIVLMENAALRVVEFLEMKFAPLREKRIVILCGKGNNGGDGFAIARHLANLDCSLLVLCVSSEELRGDALLNYEMLLHCPTGLHENDCRIITIPVRTPGKDERPADSRQTLNAATNRFHYADIVIDALLGTGFQGGVRGEALLRAFSIEWDCHATRIAVDIPSALNSDTGEAAPEALKADYTITFAAPKRGMFLQDGPEKCGEIWVGSIGNTSGQMDETQTGCEAITREKARALLPERPLDSHKGAAGRVVVCGGSYGMSGAPTLAAKAVLKSGAGLCIACVPDRVLPIFAAAFSEATSHPLACDAEGRLIESAADAVAEYWQDAHAVALGPGLSRSDGALNFARRVVRECPHPLVVDADALYALPVIAEDVKKREAPTILTPHPGEMGELMEMEIQDVQNARIETAIGCAQKYGAIVVLKGSRSIVALPNGETHINLTGNSGMATGGAGDVLTGTIAGLLAQLKDAQSATLLGVYLHGLAGDIEYSRKGNGLIAGDIADALPDALLELQKPDAEYSNARLRKLQ